MLVGTLLGVNDGSYGDRPGPLRIVQGRSDAKGRRRRAMSRSDPIDRGVRLRRLPRQRGKGQGSIGQSRGHGAGRDRRVLLGRTAKPGAGRSMRSGRGCVGRGCPSQSGNDRRRRAAPLVSITLHLSLFGLELSLRRREDVARLGISGGEPETARVALAGGQGRDDFVLAAARQDYFEQTESTIDQSRQPPSLPGGSHDLLGRRFILP